MPRILADLPDDDVKWLDRLAEEQGRSRAAVLREAVSAYRGESSGDWIDRGFGLWKRRTVVKDAVAGHHRDGASYTGPGGEGYAAAQSESRDLFDGADDRHYETDKGRSTKRGTGT